MVLYLSSFGICAITLYQQLQAMVAMMQITTQLLFYYYYNIDFFHYLFPDIALYMQQTALMGFSYRLMPQSVE